MSNDNENPFADAFDEELSTEEEALKYIREHGDLVSSDPIKKQAAINKIIDGVVYGKKDKPDNTNLDRLHEVRKIFNKNKICKNIGVIDMEFLHWMFIVYGILYSIGYIIFNFWS